MASTLGDALAALPGVPPTAASEALDQVAVLRRLRVALANSVLIVVGNFERLLNLETGEPFPFGRQLLGAVADSSGPGRVLFEVARVLPFGQWTERFRSFSLEPPSEEDATDLLSEVLRNQGVKSLRNREAGPVVRWLGRNPRAMTLLASALVSSSLDELLEIEDLGWQQPEAHGTPELLRQIEERLLGRVLETLTPASSALLDRLCVHRTSLEGRVIAELYQGDVPGCKEARDVLVRRYVLRREGPNHFDLAPMVREVALARLRDRVEDLRRYHHTAGEYHLRPFKGKRPDDSARLAISFAEARYHLVAACRESELRIATEALGGALTRAIKHTTRIPSDVTALNERIATLSVFLNQPGPWQLEYHLARLLLRRKALGDLERGLTHVRRACVADADGNYVNWLLYAELAEAVSGPAEADKVLEEGIGKIPPEHNLYALYQQRAQILERMGKPVEADKVLEEGIGRISQKLGGYKLVENRVLLAAAIGSAQRLKALALEYESPQREFASALAFAASGHWEAVRKYVESCGNEFRKYIPLTALFALANLATNNLDGAWDAISDLDNRNIVSAWLRALIALRRSDFVEAATSLSAIPIAAGRPVALDTLRFLRDEAQGRNDIQYWFPIIPPGIFQDDQRNHPRRTEPSRRALDILVVATEWFSWHGGLSTFNRDLCCEMARIGHHVICYVPGASSEEASDAKKDLVTLVTLPPGGRADKSDLVRRPQLPDGFVPQVVIGHDRQTGHQAKVLQNEHFPDAFRIHFIHTAPDQIEWFKEAENAGLEVDAREADRAYHCAGANLVAAVGPLLARDIASQLEAARMAVPVFEFLPGVRSGAMKRKAPANQDCLLVGRAEDPKIKGLDIAAQAVGFSMRKGLTRARLVIRGVETNHKALEERLRQEAEYPDLKVNAKPYVVDRELIRQGIRMARLVLMPSRTEGFGLVGLEAIEEGSAVLISDQSGLAEALRRDIPDLAEALIVPTPVATAATDWGFHTWNVLRAPAGHYNLVDEVRSALAEIWTWPIAIDGLLSHVPNTAGHYG
ncbi:MAG TPA: glycosyltransferase family 4 protein [Fimbriimonadaceae bacterium]|nr:glycosyltransferase family 4 protein [Fimbriimonadaceae bacterium]